MINCGHWSPSHLVTGAVLFWVALCFVGKAVLLSKSTKKVKGGVEVGIKGDLDISSRCFRSQLEVDVGGLNSAAALG